MRAEIGEVREQAAELEQQMASRDRARCAARCAPRSSPTAPTRPPRSSRPSEADPVQIPVERRRSVRSLDAGQTDSPSSPRRRSPPRSGSRPRTATPRSRPAHLLLALLEQEDGLVARCCASSAPTSPRSPSAPARRSPRCPRSSGDDEPEIRPVAELHPRPPARREGDGGARRRVHLGRAPPARARRQGLRRRRPAPRPRLAGQGGRRGARPAPGHLAEPRGHGRRRWRSSAAT